MWHTQANRCTPVGGAAQTLNTEPLAGSELLYFGFLTPSPGSLTLGLPSEESEPEGSRLEAEKDYHRSSSPVCLVKLGVAEVTCIPEFWFGKSDFRQLCVGVGGVNPPKHGQEANEIRIRKIPSSCQGFEKLGGSMACRRPLPAARAPQRHATPPS